MTKNVKILVMMSIFTALMIISAWIRIPIPPLPAITFQLFVAVASGIFLGSAYGAIAMGVYLILGLIGVPVFTNGGGLSYIFQPTFGFIIGFILAAFITGALWTDSWPGRVLAIVLAVLSCYVIGIPYFWMILNSSKPMAITAATLTMLPYLAKDLVLGGVLFAFAQVMGRVAPDLVWKNKKSLT